jgi:DNA polymerase III delta subunit
MANRNSTITITSATVRVQDGKTHIDAKVNGEEQQSFVFFDGDSNGHIDAAYQYLRTLGLFASEIIFVEYTNEDDSVDDWQLDQIYASQYAHASGYID